MTEGHKPLSQPQAHISVCICTYERPEMLRRALEGVTCQKTGGRFSFEVIVVDNDCNRSAEELLKGFREHSDKKIVYDCEPEQNIALARNRCVRNATGNLIAFLDDDEVPVKDWLVRLHAAMREYGADGALGPVLASYPPGAPGWLVKGSVFDRRRFSTGTLLTVRDTRTGNALLARELFAAGSKWFDPAFGRTGGEDVDFFGRHLERGRVFVWCDEAVAYETIPPERWQTTFHLKRYLRSGKLNGERLRNKGLAGIMELLKAVVAVPVWSVVLLAFFPFGKHHWIRPALKVTYSGGAVLAYCGLSLPSQRDD